MKPIEFKEQNVVFGKDLECVCCHKQGYVIETGELFDFSEE